MNKNRLIRWILLLILLGFAIFLYNIIEIGAVPVCLAILFLGKHISDYLLYCSIEKHGNRKIGTLISCTTPIFRKIISGHVLSGGSFNLDARKAPIVKFYTNQGKYEIEAFGVYREAPCAINQEIEIFYWEQYDDYVIFSEKKYKKSFLNHIIFCGVAEVFLCVLLIFMI